MTPSIWELSTAALLDAIEAEDLEAVARTLERRTELLTSAAPPTLRALELGHQACDRLILLKQKIAADSARLQQLRAYL